MKKFFTLSLMCTNLIFGIQEVKADYDYWSIKAVDTEGISFYTVDS